MRPLLPSEGGYDALVAGFRWAVPERLNMARQACFAWAEAEPERLALIDLSTGDRRDVRSGELAAMVRGLAAHLARSGVRRGDLVGVFRGQDPWCAAAHLAVWTLGAISLPLFKPFGPEALAARLGD